MARQPKQRIKQPQVAAISATSASTTTDDSATLQPDWLTERPERRWITVLIVLALVVLAGVVGGYLFQQRIAVIEDLVRYENLSNEQSDAPQTYPQSPPVGGVHSPQWQSCGAYDQPIKNELAVHSLARGAVWITYRPDLPADTIKRLQGYPRGRTHMLVSPYPDQTAPIVATAWGLQITTAELRDVRLAQFISFYAGGPQAPQRGAACSGGVGTPLPQ